MELASWMGAHKQRWVYSNETAITHAVIQSQLQQRLHAATKSLLLL